MTDFPPETPGLTSQWEAHLEYKFFKIFNILIGLWIEHGPSSFLFETIEMDTLSTSFVIWYAGLNGVLAKFKLQFKKQNENANI